MSRDGLVPTKSNRRDFLKVTAATIGISSIPLAASAKSTPESVGIKGTRRRPVKMKHIENARAQVLETPSVSSDTTQVMLAGDPTPDDGYLAGYALAVRDGAPIERIFRVSKPQPVSEVQGGPRSVSKTNGEPDRIALQETTQGPARNRSDTLRGTSPDEYWDRQERDAHNSIERFLSEKGGK